MSYCRRWFLVFTYFLGQLFEFDYDLFLKTKGVILYGSQKYLAENEPYGSVKHERNDHGTEFTQVF